MSLTLDNLRAAWKEYFKLRLQVYKKFLISEPNHPFFRKETYKPIRKQFDNEAEFNGTLEQCRKNIARNEEYLSYLQLRL